MTRSPCSTQPLPPPCPSRRPSRRGAAILIVLGLLAVAIAVSLSMNRTQFTVFQIQQNARAHGDARQAALTGATLALREMHSSDWAGPETSRKIKLSETHSCEIRYATGDESLSEGDPKYAQYPYRVTITSRGIVTANSDSAPSEHTIRVVVELERRVLPDKPSRWEKVQPYTLYQWKTSRYSRFYVEPLVRLEGNVRIQNKIYLCPFSPLDKSARRRWLQDLNQMRTAGLQDQRPFSGQIALPDLGDDKSTEELLRDDLRLELKEERNRDEPSWSYPLSVASYRLYPGGKEYRVHVLSSPLANVKLRPEPKTNPLGVFNFAGNLDIKDHVSIEGTLIAGDVNISGSDVSIKPFALPLGESSATTELPSMLVGDDLRLKSGAHGAIRGLVAINDELELRLEHSHEIGFAFAGRILLRELLIRPRREWLRSDDWWEDELRDFKDQLKRDSAIRYFPQWLERRGLPSGSVLTIKADSSAVSYHWPDWNQPLFVRHPSDAGLRWRVVTWRDLPPKSKDAQ